MAKRRWQWLLSTPHCLKLILIRFLSEKIANIFEEFLIRQVICSINNPVNNGSVDLFGVIAQSSVSKLKAKVKYHRMGCSLMSQT